MTYRSRILEDGHIDMGSLPALPPGTEVEVTVPKTVESLHALFDKLAKLGESSQEIYTGPYNREVIYGDHD